MIDLGRVANNALVVGILLGFGYLVLIGLKNNRMREKIKNLFGGFNT